MTSRTSLPFLLTTLVAALLVPAAPAGAASADGTRHPHVQPGLPDNKAVTTPGGTFASLVPLVNRTRTKQTAWVTFSRTCLVGGSKQEVLVSQQKVTVPADKNPTATGAYPVRFVKAAVPVPQECADGLEVGDQIGWTSVNVTTDRPTAPGGAVYELLHWGRPLTRKNREFNLKIHAKAPKPRRNYELHHAYPVKYAKKFAALGLPVHDPRHLRWWCDKPNQEGGYRSRVGAYNAAWKKFFARNKKPSLTKVVLFRRDLERPTRFSYHC
ncbi:hypothetical protein [Nocardioides daphniae]|uniref:Uncharacterized protein n=1 Tax=Nocardioides daphniae TaxID=402297 RepID=A0A4P7U840_9ACTN|nr:hypothetical protein [Nocardioides daphniae]QCC76312.1 hypothetical protein E2C04_02160 [Nocardioides daphniae]GGD08060.1 hypothetical protein GCM10007231_03540 [Nocardioides daphniae]